MLPKVWATMSQEEKLTYARQHDLEIEKDPYEDFWYVSESPRVMLSELLAQMQEIFNEHGDMPIEHDSMGNHHRRPELEVEEYGSKVCKIYGAIDDEEGEE